MSARDKISEDLACGPVADSDDTRERLLRAGLNLFGSFGLDGVSTRRLAEAAHVNQAAIPYHFGGKEGVYRAVAANLVATTGAKMRGIAERASTEDGDAGVRLRTLLSGAALIILREPDAPSRAGFILREQLQPTAAFDILYEGFMRPFHETLSSLVAELQGGDAQNPKTIFNAHALLGQLLSFGVARQLLLRRLGKKDLTEEDANDIADVVAAIAERAFPPPAPN